MTKVKLEKISNPDIHLFIERGRRGGICYISKRYSQANNELCPEYDETKPKVYIKYFDMNNLYGKVTSEYLLYGGVKWVKVNNEVINRILNESSNNLHRYFLEIDLEIQEKLHDIHTDLPIAPEEIKVTEKMLSPFQLEIKKEYDIKVGVTNKLIPNLYPKNNYVVHYRSLQYYLSQGAKLITVHKILEFKQSAWMKPYIEFNTERRKEATNEADKNLFKLLNNAAYGKTMENMRKRMKVRVTTTEKDYIKYASRTTFINHKIYDKDFVVIHEEKELLTLNKPIYAGCTVLELSKLAMYEFFYDFLQKKSRNIELLYMNTDSFIIEITDENFDEIMYECKEYFDLSNLRKDCKYYCGNNKKVPGKMKDEYGGTPIVEFILPKPKSYTLIDGDNYEKSRHKSHSPSFKSSKFKDVVNNKKVIRHPMKKITSKKHKIYTQESNKISLSCFDDKRYIKDDGIHTLAHGHKDIPRSD